MASLIRAPNTTPVYQYSEELFERKPLYSLWKNSRYQNFFTTANTVGMSGASITLPANTGAFVYDLSNTYMTARVRICQQDLTNLPDDAKVRVTIAGLINIYKTKI
jgi:hypothetical protein